MSSAVTTADLVIVGLEATDKVHATRQLAERLVAAGRVTNIETYLDAVAKREEHFPTGIEGGIAIPHAQSDSVTMPSVAIATSHMAEVSGDCSGAGGLAKMAIRARASAS